MFPLFHSRESKAGCIFAPSGRLSTRISSRNSGISITEDKSTTEATFLFSEISGSRTSAAKFLGSTSARVIQEGGGGGGVVNNYIGQSLPSLLLILLTIYYSKGSHINSISC